jgi:hypothetical protein
MSDTITEVLKLQRELKADMELVLDSLGLAKQSKQFRRPTDQAKKPKQPKVEKLPEVKQLPEGWKDAVIACQVEDPDPKAEEGAKVTIYRTAEDFRRLAYKASKKKSPKGSWAFHNQTGINKTYDAIVW